MADACRDDVHSLLSNNHLQSTTIRMASEVKKWAILGVEWNVLVALWMNVVSWTVSKFVPSFLPQLLPPCKEEDTSPTVSPTQTRCISIGRPGGLEQLRLVTLKPGIATIGYNLKQHSPPPFSQAIQSTSDVPKGSVVISNKAFSVNYADCCIRWGLYESALQFVGFPIAPGFDVAGVVEMVPPGNDGPWNVGDNVFGVTLFGAYSSRVLVPSVQLRKIPASLSFEQAAAIPAVALTALYALHLAGHFPQASKCTNRAILIHSAAGGVGSMLVQMSKILGLSPVVGVVGKSSKVDFLTSLGCDVVIDKSTQDLWQAAREASPDGYAAIMDANGVSTLQQSYDHLAPTGRLIVFGFHSNLPMGRAALSPLEWIRMAVKMSSMPKFDPMDLTVSNKSVMGFNLSFFEKEVDLVSLLFDQVCEWLEQGKLTCPRIVEMDMTNIGEAHNLIMSGKSVGKIVIRT